MMRVPVPPASALARFLASVAVSASLVVALVPADALASAAARGEAPAGDELSAEEEYDLGEQAYALGNYEEAVGHFERCYAKSKHPNLLYNIGQSYDRLYEISQDPKHLRKAKRLFLNYVKFLEQSEGLDEATKASVEQHIVEIDEKLAAVEPVEEPDPDPDPPEPDPPEPEPEGPQDPTPSGTTDPPVDEPELEDKPIYKKGWFWGTIVGVLAVAGGVTAAVLLTRDNGEPIPDPELGTIGRSGRAQQPAPRPGPSFTPGGLVFSF